MTAKDDSGFSHMQKGRTRAAMIGVLWAGVASLAPMIVTALVFLLTSRILQPADFGIVAFAAALVGTIAVISPSGFSDAIVQHKEIGGHHLDTVFWLCLGAGVVLYLIVLAITPFLAEYYHDPRIGVLMPVLGIRVILDQLNLVPRSLLSRAMAFRRIAFRTTLASLVAAAVCLAVLFAGYGLWALVASQLVISLVSCIVSWASVDWRPSFRFSRGAFSQIAGFGAYSSGSQIVTAINVDQLLIGSLMGPAALGLFGFARRIFQMMLDVMTGTLGSVTYPLLASMQDEMDKLRRAYMTATFLSSVLAFPAFIGLALVADRLVPLLFGPQWTEAVTPLRAFCALGILACIGILQSSLIRSRGRADIWMWYQILQQVLTGIVILATFRQGIATVAVAMAIKTWLVWPLTTVLAARLIQLPIGPYLRQFLLPFLASLAMAVVVLGLDAELPEAGWALAVQILAGGLCYLLVILLLARKRLREIVPRRRRRAAEGSA